MCRYYYYYYYCSDGADVLLLLLLLLLLLRRTVESPAVCQDALMSYTWQSASDGS